jgi:hypothetical protein
MTIYGIASGASPALQGAGSKFFLPGATEFADKLTVGQIIKGKVLRQFEGNRYLVNFDGNERVVDSAVPMKTGELINGRVVGLGERVELQRVYLQELAGQNTPSRPEVAPPLAGRSGNEGDALDSLMVRYQAQMRPEEQVVLTRAMRSAGDATAMAGTAQCRVCNAHGAAHAGGGGQQRSAQGHRYATPDGGDRRPRRRQSRCAYTVG